MKSRRDRSELPQISVRLPVADKGFFAETVERDGFEAGTALRIITELVVARLRQGSDFIGTLAVLKAALRGEPTPLVGERPPALVLLGAYANELKEANNSEGELWVRRAYEKVRLGT